MWYIALLYIALLLKFLTGINVNMFPNSPWSIFFVCYAKLFVYLKILISIFIEHSWQGSKRKCYDKIVTEQVDWLDCIISVQSLFCFSFFFCTERCTLRSEKIFGIWNPFKNDGNFFFFFTLKAPFVIKILTFCLNFLVMWKNGLIRKIRLIPKCMTSQPV